MTSQPLNPGVTTPTFAEAIANVSMLARVATTAYWDRAIDKRASAEIDQDKHAVTGTARVTIKLLAGADTLHNQRYAIQKQAQNNLNELSTYWSHGGWRLLPNANFEKFIGEHYRLLGEDKKLATEMELQVEEICATARANLSNFNVEPPTPEKLLGSYTIKEIFQEVPTGRFHNAPAGAEEWLKSRFEENFKQQYEHGLMAKLAEVVKPLTVVFERLNKIDEPVKEGEREPKLRAVLVQNLVEVIDQLEASDLTRDPVIQGFINEMQLFRNVHPDDLQKNGLLRGVAKSKASETIERLKNTLGPIGLI